MPFAMGPECTRYVSLLATQLFVPQNCTIYAARRTQSLPLVAFRFDGSTSDAAHARTKRVSPKHRPWIAPLRDLTCDSTIFNDVRHLERPWKQNPKDQRGELTS